MPIRKAERDEVGYAKRLRTTATLYENGLLVIETFSENRAPFSGLRGRVLVVCFDHAGVAHWVSQEFACTTRCSLLDATCASSGTNAWTQQLPEQVGRLSRSLDIVHYEADAAPGQRDNIIRGIKDTVAVLAEIQALYGLLVV